MSELIQSVWGFVLAIGVLVTFHEFGHYWVARRLGVRVLCFSVGFGRPLWQRTAANGTVWQIAAIPLGGYVKMLDEREAEVPAEQLDQAFNRQPLGTRAAVVAAGPIANFLLAIVLYSAVYMIGQPAVKPIVGAVTEGTPAALSGVPEGAVVTAVDGKSVRTWDELRLSLLDAALDDSQIALRVQLDEFRQERFVMDVSAVSREPAEFLDQVGLEPPKVVLRPVLGGIVADSPAARGGLERGDVIVELDGNSIESWEALVLAVRERPGADISLTVLRDGASQSISIRLDDLDGIGRLGAGVAEQPELWQDFAFDYRLGPLPSLWAGVQQTLQVSWLTVKMLGRMIVGELSPRNLSGPLSIAEFAGMSAAAGVVAFLGFLALVSVSLGVLNLLPVPVLDGGHLLFYAIEALMGAPLSERAQQVGQSVGMALLFGLMSVALFNDLNRLLG